MAYQHVNGLLQQRFSGRDEHHRAFAHKKLFEKVLLAQRGSVSLRYRRSGSRSSLKIANDSNR